MKKYGVLYNETTLECAGNERSKVRWPAFNDEDHSFGTDNINEAFQFMNELLAAYEDVTYRVVEK